MSAREFQRRHGKRGGRRRSGAGHEAALCALLERCGYADIDSSSICGSAKLYVRGYAWGLYLTPPRKYQSDAAIPALRLLFESDGGAHYATRRQGVHDTERRGLASTRGWVVVALTPEQIDGDEGQEIVGAAIARAALTLKDTA